MNVPNKCPARFLAVSLVCLCFPCSSNAFPRMSKSDVLKICSYDSTWTVGAKHTMQVFNNTVQCLWSLPLHFSGKECV